MKKYKDLKIGEVTYKYDAGFIGNQKELIIGIDKIKVIKKDKDTVLVKDKEYPITIDLSDSLNIRRVFWENEEEALRSLLSHTISMQKHYKKHLENFKEQEKAVLEKLGDNSTTEKT